ncbi:hypothetical protein COU59_00005 [Candidatus Pacearchaeota archaeon CG10_big_fil_rev_8_21_14_0_10_34_12]|nr:MAG: hypothetical protein COU59_00005 [Candidatus Pacearchaeota archaeon CG10_big_fil_rev_8_21_14_0_10_34_12]
MNFIKKIFVGNVDGKTHNQLIRFGKGEYGKRALLGMWKTKSIKIRGSFEFASDFALFAAELGKVSFNGTIISREGIEGLKGKKKEGKYVYEVIDFTSEDVKRISEEVYCFLLNGEGEGIKLKTKAKLPKPGKSEGKVDDKFCQLEVDDMFYQKVKEEFFWDIPDGKKISVKHKFMIKEIIPPQGEKDFAKIRELAKRKGNIIRNSVVDGKDFSTEKEFEA